MNAPHERADLVYISSTSCQAIAAQRTLEVAAQSFVRCLLCRKLSGKLSLTGEQAQSVYDEILRRSRYAADCGLAQTLGMAEYAERFTENAIDFSVLPDLTDQDLEKIGVLLGHRRKLLRAIAEFAAGRGVAAARVNRPKSQETAERRQVTVMFSDLVGSTALSARMDPEDLREVISAYQNCVADTVGRFGGFVAKYMGDGVLVYFGYPHAHEDDAERAVRAGLELVTAVSDLKTYAALQTRVGIATGLVVVGDLIGSGASQEQAIVGDTPNLAARLQGIAEANSVMIAEDTRKLLGNLFELEDLGTQDLKGIADRCEPGRRFDRFSRGPLRGYACEGTDRPRRAGRRTRLAASALVESKEWRRSSGVALR